MSKKYFLSLTRSLLPLANQTKHSEIFDISRKYYKWLDRLLRAYTCLNVLDALKKTIVNFAVFQKTLRVIFRTKKTFRIYSFMNNFSIQFFWIFKQTEYQHVNNQQSFNHHHNNNNNSLPSSNLPSSSSLSSGFYSNRPQQPLHAFDIAAHSLRW